MFRKKHLKDIRRLGSDFKWKLNQGVKRLLQQLTLFAVVCSVVLFESDRQLKGSRVVKIALVNIICG